MQVKQGIYQHYKGQLYQVFHVATHSETREKLWSTSACMMTIPCGLDP